MLDRQKIKTSRIMEGILTVKEKMAFFLSLAMIFVALNAATCISGDLDDGISKSTEDGISKWDNLGQADRNINFMKLDAKSRSEVRKKSGMDVTGGNNSAGSINSVVLGAGGTVKGDIIIIDESKGDKTQIIE